MRWRSLSPLERANLLVFVAAGWTYLVTGSELVAIFGAVFGVVGVILFLKRQWASING